MLIPFLLHTEVNVYIATLSDDFYIPLLQARDIQANNDHVTYLAGRDLIEPLLEQILSEAQMQRVTLVCLNPSLYEADEVNAAGTSIVHVGG
jgi:hypothetical protein